MMGGWGEPGNRTGLMSPIRNKERQGRAPGRGREDKSSEHKKHKGENETQVES